MKRGKGPWKEMYPNKRPKSKGPTPGGQNKGCGTLAETIYAQATYPKIFPSRNVMKRKKGKI